MIFVSAGHNPKAKGASFAGVTEFGQATLWAHKIHNHLLKRTESTLVPTGTLGSKVRYINSLSNSNKDIAIEIHFNDVPGRKAKGSETLYYPRSSTGKRLAETIQNALETNSLFLPNRGIKEGFYHGSNGRKLLYFLSKTKPVAVIIEPEFIYNLDSIWKDEDEACRVIADTLVQFQEELL